MTLPTALHAQGASDQDEIIVTGTRRVETAQSAPINIAAISGAQLEEQRTLDLREIARSVPGIYVVDQGARSGAPIVFRGLNGDPLGSFDGNNDGGGTVATYVGEIPLYIDLRLNDMERVEVLLGPQGTLYGAGTLGGAIRYIPNRPEFDNFKGEVRTGFYKYKPGSGLSTDTGATINVPLADNLAFRASFDFLNDRGFIDYAYVVDEIGRVNPNDFSTGVSRKKDLNSNETVSGRAALRFLPAAGFDISLTYFYQNQLTEGRQFSSYRNTILPEPVGKWESALRVREPNRRINQLVSLEAVADLGFAELTSASGYSKFTEKGNRDQTDLLISLEYSYEAFPNFTAYTLEQGKSETYTQEVRLVSKGEGPFNWIIGGFYNRNKQNGFSKEFTPHLDEFFVSEFGGVQLYPENLEYYSVDKRKLVEKAVFGELGYEVLPGWDFTVGGRYYHYDLKTQSAVDLPLYYIVFEGRDPTQIVLDYEDGGQKDSGFLWKANTSYRVTPDVLLYGTVSKGYRIGNSNGVAPCPIPLPPNQIVCALPNEMFFGPDKTTNYEIGVKSQWFDRAVTFNAAFYYIKWADPQVQSATENGSQPVRINGAGAETKGFELHGVWNIAPGLSVTGNYAYTDPELTKFTPKLIAYLEGPGFPSLYDDGQPGDRLPGSPKHSGSIFIDYESDVSDTLTLGFSYKMTAQSNVLTRTGGKGHSLTLPGFAIHGAALTFQWGEHVSGQLFVDNIFNKFAETGVRSTPEAAQIVSNINGDDVYVRTFGTFVLPPRSIGLRTQVKF